MRKTQKRGYSYEKLQAKKHKGVHLGGPNKPDYKRGRVKAEVKNWSRPVHKGELKKAFRRGVKEVISKRSFTEPAIKYGKERKMRLVARGRSL